jgi:hypothetical protein
MGVYEPFVLFIEISFVPCPTWIWNNAGPRCSVRVGQKVNDVKTWPQQYPFFFCLSRDSRHKTATLITLH